MKQNTTSLHVLNNILNNYKMGLSLEKGRQLIELTIQKDLRHRDYKRVTFIAKQYTAFVTGEDKESLIRQFKKRESDEELQQRVELTDLVTSYIANRLMTPMFKVGRTTAAIKFAWGDKSKIEDQKKELQDVLTKYYGDVSVDDYLSTRLVELDSTDPNSFIVTEAEGSFDSNKPVSDTNKKVTPYPFEVNSEEAIDYKYRNNQLQYLTVRNEIDGLERYTMYLDNEAIVAQEVTAEFLKTYTLAQGEEIIYKNPDKKDTSRIYILSIAQHKAGKVPAIRVGGKRDLNTRNRTCVPLIHPAYSFFMKSIKTISEFDLTQTLHAFPQKITYKPACPGNVEENIICNKGKTPEGKRCSVCNGTGKLSHTSASDVIEVELPNDIKDIVSLENFIAYKHPPIDLLQFMRDLGLDKYPDLAVRAVYCSELLTPDTTTTTATEKVLDLETVYDALKPFADAYSAVNKHIVTIAAAYRDLSKDFTYEHKFPKDFKMKSLDILLDDLKKAKDSGAPSYIINQIVSDIEFKMFVDDPQGLLKIAVKRKYFPFNGKSEAQIESIIAGDLTTRYNKVLYANFDQIFDELDMENSTDTIDFYRLEPAKQTELVKNKVMEKIMAIDEESSAANAVAFGKANGDTGAASGDTQDYNAGDQVTLNDGTQVTIDTAQPSSDGGEYSVKLPDGSVKQVKGTDIQS